MRLPDWWGESDDEEIVVLWNRPAVDVTAALTRAVARQHVGRRVDAPADDKIDGIVGGEVVDLRLTRARSTGAEPGGGTVVYAVRGQVRDTPSGAAFIGTVSVLAPGWAVWALPLAAAVVASIVALRDGPAAWLGTWLLLTAGMLVAGAFLLPIGQGAHLRAHFHEVAQSLERLGS